MGESMRRAMIRLGLAEPEDPAEQPRQHTTEEPRVARTETHEPRPEQRPDGRRDEAAAEGGSHRAPRVGAGESRAGGSTAVRQGGDPRSVGAVRARPAREPRRDPEYRAPVTPIKRAPSTSREDADDMRTITTVHPRSYNDAKSVGESFRDGTPVIMDLSELPEAEAKRLVDFAAGLVFALHGAIERVTTTVFLLTPSYVEVIDSSAPAAEEDLEAAQA